MTCNTTWALKWMELTREVVATNREYLIDLDRLIGDGDHGENLDRGFTQVVSALEAAAPETVQDVLKIVAKTLMSTVGGAAGPLYGTAFLRAAKAAEGEELDANGITALLAGALEGIQARGKAVEGEKTMVDAWAPATRAAAGVAGNAGTALEALTAAAAAAEEGAGATEGMQATKGRASYLGARSIGHLDPGAVSTSLILRAACDAAAVQ